MENSLVFDMSIEMVSGTREKYSYDDATGSMKQDRVLPQELASPFHYGFVHNTIGGDNEPVDAFVLSNRKLGVGDKVKGKPIGIIHAADESGIDSKIVMVDTSDGDFSGMVHVNDVPKESMNALLQQLEHNKDGLPGKWTKVERVGGPEEAHAYIKKYTSKG